MELNDTCENYGEQLCDVWTSLSGRLEEHLKEYHTSIKNR